MNADGKFIEVAVVEDDAQVRDRLVTLISSSAGFHCAAACASGEEASQRLPAVAPDVVLMDIHLPGMSGIDCIRRLKKQQPRLQITMLTVFDDHDRIFQSLTAGASGYWLKQTPPSKLMEAIAELHNGGSPMSAQIARRVVETFQRPAAPATTCEDLAPRENDIIRLLARGFLYKEIADHLGLSVETVRTHLHRIYDKLHVRSRTEAVMKNFGKDSGR